jgi:hydrogenase maturation protease
VTLLGDRCDAGESAPRVLIAGVGNLHAGDDGFGVVVARQVAARPLPPGIEVRDFGTRGYDLALALCDDLQAAILVDAMPRGGRPGTLHVIEPGDMDEAHPLREGAAIDGHALTPVAVIALARRLGASLVRLYVVGCEPAWLPDPGEVDDRLSQAVAAQVDEAAALAIALARRVQEHGHA